MKIFWLFLLLPQLVFSQTWQAESTNKQMPVLELFTSEGCGLCPAADRWVEHFHEPGVADDDLIVLVFHIDYLNDKKGWIDRFAQPRFSERQRQLARINLYKTVYTPEFFISGEVVHNWQSHAKKVIEAVSTFQAEADIALTVKQQEENFTINAQTTVRGDSNRTYAKLYLAVIEDDVVNKVNGGDNAGQTFNHQNLVRVWLGPYALSESGETETLADLKLDKTLNQEKLNVVALIQNLDDGFVLQGLSVPIKNRE